MKDSSHSSKRAGRPDSSGARSKIIPGRVGPDSVDTTGSLFWARWLTWCATVGPVGRFGLKFSALMALYYLLVLTPFCDRMLYAYLGLNAWLAHSILNWFGQDSHVSEITIRSARFAITVRRGCDAIEPSWFFCAALLSFPASFRQKAVGILAGTVLLQALNLIRIVSLYFIGIFYPKFFGTAHVEVWPVVFIIVAILFWLGWIRWSQRPVKPRLNGVA